MGEMIRLVGVLKGRTENHLIFTGYVPRLDNSRLYSFDYTGVEIEYTNAGITDLAKQNLTECLNEDFGYAPFDIEKAKAVLSTDKEYCVAFWKDK